MQHIAFTFRRLTVHCQHQAIKFAYSKQLSTKLFANNQNNQQYKTNFKVSI